MKNHLNKALVALVLLGAGAQLQAHKYEFANHTDKTIAVSLTYKGVNEKRRVRVIQPDTQEEFIDGSFDIDKSKWGFIPSRFEYIVNPKAEVINSNIKDNKTRSAYMNTTSNRFPWKSFSITWLPSETYDLALELADTLGAATELAAKTGMKAGAAYMTGGASAVAEGAADLAEKAAAGTGKVDALNKVAEAEFGLGKIFAAIGKSAARSLIGDHHIDIIEVPNAEGKMELKFISRL